MQLPPDAGKPHQARPFLADWGEVAAGHVAAAVFAGEDVGVRTGGEAGFVPKLVDRRANAAFFDGPVINGRVER